MMETKARARKRARRLACAAAAALAVVMVPSAFAANLQVQAGIQPQAAAITWTVPTSAASVDDHVVTVGSHSGATGTADMLGLDGTVYPGQSGAAMRPSTLAEASSMARLGVYGSSANKAPDPYLANLFYNFYADANGLAKSDNAAVVDTQAKAQSYAFYTDENPDYGTNSELALRPDIVVGISNSTGAPYDVRMNYATTNAKNHLTWGSGASMPSQPYALVLEIRRHTNDASLVGTRNSDGNVYATSEHYRDGDEGYDPIGVLYNDGTSSSGINYAVGNANALAWAAERVMQQDSQKRGRYGDPLSIANDYEGFAKALKWGILSRQASGGLQRKTVAVVGRVYDSSSDSAADHGTFRLVKMNPDGDSTQQFSAAEAAQDTVADLAATLMPDASAGYASRTSVTAEQLMAADIVVCVPSVPDSYHSNAASVAKALAEAGYTPESAGYPAIFDSTVPFGTFGTEGGMEDSVEVAMLVGLVQGFIYPEVVDPVDAMAYYSSKLFHLNDSAIAGFLASQLDGVSLPSGSSLASGRSVADSVGAVQAVIDEGVRYYYGGGKAAIDSARPRIASSDALDDANGYGVTNVRVEVPVGATFTLEDSHGLVVGANADGTYTIDDDDPTTFTVSRPGYRDYVAEVRGAGSGGVVSVTGSMVQMREVGFILPEGSTLSWVRDASGSTLSVNANGTYSLDMGTTGTFEVELPGYETYAGAIPADATQVTLSTSDFTPVSTMTTITVPTGATLVVKDGAGSVVEPTESGAYRLVNGQPYTLTVTYPGRAAYTLQVVGGDKKKVSVRLADMSKTELFLDKETVSAGDISDDDAATVESIALGSSVKKVAAKAFTACAKLKSISFGANVISIGSSAFAGCKSLSSVSLNARLSTIGASAFKDCSSLVKLVLPAKVKKVGASAFSGCKKLKALTLKTKGFVKKGVKNALKGSSVSTVKVKVGSAKANKKYVKRYKKVFTKANCGKKVAVKR